MRHALCPLPFKCPFIPIDNRMVALGVILPILFLLKMNVLR